MFYPKLSFPKFKNRPFFYTNFVQTIDGKVQVKNPGYWPIGSRTDYQILTELRAYSDCLIHGGNLAREFGDITKKSLAKSEFKNLRKKLGKKEVLPYYIISKKRTGANVVHLEGDIASHLLPFLIKEGCKNVLVEGGPTLLGSFLKEGLVDEVFLTIAPKIYGTESGKTLTLVEGILLKPDKIKKLKLLSVKKMRNELFLRYKMV